jgi:hypothetical protein
MQKLVHVLPAASLRLSDIDFDDVHDDDEDIDDDYLYADYENNINDEDEDDENDHFYKQKIVAVPPAQIVDDEVEAPFDIIKLVKASKKQQQILELRHSFFKKFSSKSRKGLTYQ